MTGEAQTGFFGKVPALGDFVQRRLPKEFVDTWDGWLQQAVAASKTSLGEGWLQTYLSSPIWRFGLGRDVCGPTPWAGVLMPSVDRVGRYFPLTIAAPLAADSQLFALVREQEWFEQAEKLALSSLQEEGFALDDFSQSVADLGAIETANVAGIDSGGSDMGAGWQINIESIAAVDAGLFALLEQLATDRFGSVCLWWSDGSDHVAPSLMFSPGLPQPDSFTGLLDGRFRDWSWQPLLQDGGHEAQSVAGLLENL